MNYNILLLTIKAKRKLHQIPQSRIAFKMGITRSYYSQLEGGVSKLKLGSYVEICKILKIDPVELLGQALNNKGDI
jgi:transcriptional regulator with XRE-family HTH domain